MDIMYQKEKDKSPMPIEVAADNLKTNK